MSSGFAMCSSEWETLEIFGGESDGFGETIYVLSHTPVVGRSCDVPSSGDRVHGEGEISVVVEWETGHWNPFLTLQVYYLGKTSQGKIA